MINTVSLRCVLLFFLFTFSFQTTFSQDLAQSTALRPFSKMYSMSNSVAIKNAVLTDGKYTYKFKNRDILVEIKDGFYYEYHPKKEYIKAKIDWLSEYEYQLIIIDMEKRGVPFTVGSKLIAKITKIKGDEYFYTSRLNNKTGNGSFKKVK